MKFLVDNQLPVQLAKHLRGLGHDCRHVMDIGLDDVDDVIVWKRCGEEGLVLISKDEDFVFLATRAGDSGRLIWVRVGNCRNDALIATFDRLHDRIIQSLDAGQRIVELR